MIYRRLSLILANVLSLFVLVILVQKPKTEDIDVVSQNSQKILPVETSQPENSRTKYFIVKRVIDGDTIELESGEKVRYIGIDTPENRQDECYFSESKLENEKLVLGKRVLLETDISNFDKYKRLLRYVYTLDKNGEKEIFVNKFLVENGFAKVATFTPDVKYSNDFVTLEKYARENSLGLWSVCN